MSLEEFLSRAAAAASAFSLFLSVYTYIAGLRRERRQATIDAYNQLEKEALDKVYFYSAKEVEEIANNPKKPEYKELSLMLARFDQFAVGVNTKVYDIRALRRLAGSYIGIQYDKLLPLIKAKRTGSPGVYQELDTLVDSMPSQKWRRKAAKAKKYREKEKKTAEPR